MTYQTFAPSHRRSVAYYESLEATGQPRPISGDAIAKRYQRIKADKLNAFMEFDCPIEVHSDGTVSRAPQSISAPDMEHGDLEDARLSWGDAREWSLMRGYTGQHGYNGPSMHSSEFIGGGMARDILATPGYYVAIVDEAPCHYEKHTKKHVGMAGTLMCSCGAVYCEDEPTDCTEDSGCNCEPAGWAVAYHHTEEG